MGRIRNVYIKSLSDKLLESQPDKFTDDFNKNKKVVDKLVNAESKKIRNRLAGYITHALKKKERLHVLKISYQQPYDTRKEKRWKRRRK